LNRIARFLTPGFACLLAAIGVLIGFSPHTWAAGPAFDPVAFFNGTTVGEGELKKALSSAEASHVVSHGRVEGDGTLVLDQTVAIAGEPLRRREWRLRESAPGRYTGTISDAAGAVTARVDGPVLSIAYRTKDKMSVQQAITLAPGGQSARNVMKIRRFGITFATLEETITRR